jgi:hypothetical protein
MSQVVRYRGTADVRLLTSANLTALGVQQKEGGEVEVRWDKSNGFSVPKDELEKLLGPAYRVAIEEDPGFVVEGDKEEEEE